MVMNVFYGITLAVWVYFIIPSGIVLLGSWVHDKLCARRDRRRLNELLEAEKAELEKLRTHQ